MNEVKNKACPFCGDGVIKAQALMLKNYPAGYNAMCDNCESTGPYAETPEGALEKWNVRAGGEQPKAAQNSEAEGQFAPCHGCAALVDWLKAEMDDDEIGKINARDHGEWSRYEHLEGHRTGLLHVLHHIRAAQHNDPNSPTRI